MTPADMQQRWSREAVASAKATILSSGDLSDAEFFESGLTWMQEFAALAEMARIPIKGTAALDFGCGMGRMTQALAPRYVSVTGIDVSDKMIQQARDLNSNPNVTFAHVLESPWPFADRSFDLAFSTIAIQHIAPPHNRAALSELFRVSRDLAFFDVPSRKLSPDDPDPAGVFFLPRAEVDYLARQHQFELMVARNLPATGIRQYQYLFQRRV